VANKFITYGIVRDIDLIDKKGIYFITAGTLFGQGSI